MGKPQRRESSGAVGLISASVSVLLRRRPVIAEAVRLNDEAKPWPEEVDPPAVHVDLGLRRR